MNVEEIQKKYTMDASIDTKRINEKTVMEFYFSVGADGRGGRNGYTAFVPVKDIPGWKNMSGDQISNKIAEKLVKTAQWKKANNDLWMVLIKADGVFGWMYYKNKSDLKVMRKACYYNNKNNDLSIF